MRKSVIFLVSLFLVAGMSLGAAAEVNININVPAPPPLAFPAPPDVVVVPSEQTDVYLVPGTVGLYFFGGFWYRFYEGYWYRGLNYAGPWLTIYGSLVPRPVMVIPPDYILSLPPGYHRIRYGEFQSHWRNWDRSHYWSRQPWYREHAEHHWAGREFHRPPVGARPKVGAEKEVRGPGPGKPAGVGPKVEGEKGLKAGGPGPGKPVGAGPKVEGEKGLKGGGHGAGKPAGEHPKTGHPGKPE
jgi:hypothetical protein